MKQILFALVMVALPLSGNTSLEKDIPVDFALITVPKSGSHMMIKLFYLIYGRTCKDFYYAKGQEGWFFPPRLHWEEEEFDALMAGIFEEGTLPWGHMNASYYVHRYADSHPDFKVVIMIRDLRDVCVSYAHHFGQSANQYYQKSSSMDEKLMWVLTNGFGKEDGTIADFAMEASAVLDWVDHPHAMIFRYEDFVGPEGGGTVEAQEEALERLLRFLELDLTGEEKLFVLKNLYGKFNQKRLDKKLTKTFRKGQIGGWREAFTEENKRVFKERLGDLLIQFGYENDNNW